ncbi:alpha/beta hydrolase [Shimia sp.]|uniref:alpha/beta hydrolase n=1 Tax=Shimia sp. TaxID=1954381 RepID=UPI003B8CDDAC
MRLLFITLTALCVSACADRITAPMQPEALTSENTRQIYVATNRQRNEAGHLHATRGAGMTFLDTTVSIPPSHIPGQPPSFSARPDSEKHFVIAQERAIPTLQEFSHQISKDLATQPPEDREVILFVHGFYNTYQDSLFRLAQIKSDFDLRGAVVNFAWPSAGSPIGYAYDRESVLYSRDDLESTLRALGTSQNRRLLLVGHSLGSLLITETLRQIELKTPGWVARNLDGLVLISPDMPVELFVRNLTPLKTLPRPTVIMTSTQDTALRLSSRINRSNQRLGQLSNPDALADLPVIVVDVSKFSSDSSNNHMTFAESPSLISLLSDAQGVDALLAPDDPNFLMRSAERVRVTNEAIAIQVAAPADGS